MGAVKKMMLAEAEQERIDHLREIQQSLDDLHRAFPDEGWNEWDPETYEAYCEASDKDD